MDQGSVADRHMVARDPRPRNTVGPGIETQRSDGTTKAVPSRESVGSVIGSSKLMAKNAQSFTLDAAVAFQSLVTHITERDTDRSDV